MNTNPNATTVLCFGDSNTWGRLPDRTGRYAADTRWPGQLQGLLGNDFYVIEEGLGGRTTDIDDKGTSRNGKTYLRPCLESHSPVNVVIIMLGTNDFKFRFERTATDVAAAIGGLVDTVKEFGENPEGKPPRIILISPIHITPTAPRFAEFYANDYSKDSGETSTKLAEELQKNVKLSGCDFLDAALIAKTGEDGLHLDHESNALIAEAVAQLLAH